MKTRLVVGSIACLMSLRAFADCAEPHAAPAPPDGATASREDMVAATRAFRSYDATVREYTACLQRTLGSESKQSEAVYKLEKVAEKFNAELRAFKNRSGT